MRKTMFEVFWAVVFFVVLFAVCGLFGWAANAQPIDKPIDKPIDGGEVTPEPHPVDPAQQADQIFNTPSGNHVRIIGGKISGGAPVLPSPIGDAVNVPGVPADALCNVILDAIPVDIKDPETGKVIRTVPGVPELAHAFGRVSWPVRIPGSEGTIGNVYWNVMLKGADCVTAADSISYVASSISELRPFTGNMPAWKCRLLRAQIQVEEEIDGRRVTVNRTVSACDSRVNRAKDQITIPHGWAGRTRLNFRKVKNGVAQDRAKDKGSK